jgi:hypothetical protein
MNSFESKFLIGDRVAYLPNRGMVNGIVVSITFDRCYNTWVEIEYLANGILETKYVSENQLEHLDLRPITPLPVAS